MSLLTQRDIRLVSLPSVTAHVNSWGYASLDLVVGLDDRQHWHQNAAQQSPQPLPGISKRSRISSLLIIVRIQPLPNSKDRPAWYMQSPLSMLGLVEEGSWSREDVRPTTASSLSVI